MLPAQYAWLEDEGAPKILVEALKLHGTRELKGSLHNPIILGWAEELGLRQVYSADEIPWCGLFVGVVAHRAGYEPVKDPLWALNWRTFGDKSPAAGLGDVLVFVRKTATGTAGHVGIYVGEDEGGVDRTPCFHVLGGNQSDRVCITRIPKSRLRAARRPIWKIGQPPNIRAVRLAASGRMSVSEA